MKAIATVIGKDKRGIIAKISGFMFENNVNIEDISQTVMQEYFTMIMLVDISGCKTGLSELSVKFENEGLKFGVSARLMHEDIFNSMNKI